MLHLPSRGRWRPLALACAWLALGGPVQAGLFDDEEARKAILDLRARIQASDDAQSARLADQAKAHAALMEQVATLRRSVLELNAQIEAQRADNAKLRGPQEQLARDLADVQRLIAESAKGIDARLRVLEPTKVTLDGKDFMVEPDERRSHDQAMAALRNGDFEKAAAALGSFVQRYPVSGYQDSARFWLGNALYGLKNYKDAITVFRALVASSPEHPRTAEALLAVANCQIEMKDVKGARKTMEDLTKSHPTSEAAAAARERLATLKG